MEKVALQLLSNGRGLGAIFHIAGRGHLTIPAHPVLSRVPWTAALSARPSSLLQVAVNVRLGMGPLLCYPPGPPSPLGRSASAPPSFTIGSRPSGLPSVTLPGP